MRKQVLVEIIHRIKEAKYFSISINSIADVLHTDQHTFIVLYVTPSGCIEERFLTLMPIQSHKRVTYWTVLAVLEEMGIDIKDCRGQCYDNAANMSGTYKGLQACIKEINPLTEWVTYAVHTLNLVGVNSATALRQDFPFSFVQMLFMLASKSPSLWQIITSGLKPNENQDREFEKS